MDARAIELTQSVIAAADQPPPAARGPKASPETVSPAPAEDIVSLSDESKQALQRSSQQDAPASNAAADGQRTLQQRIAITDNNEVVTKFIDPETKAVIREVPPEELMRLKEGLRKVMEDLAPDKSNNGLV